LVNHLLAAESDETLIIKVVGKGTWVESETLKSFCEKKMQEGFTEIVIELKECKHLDSTFIGVLCGISLQRHKKGGGRIALINISPVIEKTFKTLGLQNIVSLWPETSLKNLKTEEITSEASSSRKGKMKHILEAHRILTEISPQSKEKFSDLLAQMEKEWEKGKG